MTIPKVISALNVHLTLPNVRLEVVLQPTPTNNVIAVEQTLIYDTGKFWNRQLGKVLSENNQVPFWELVIGKKRLTLYKR